MTSSFPYLARGIVRNQAVGQAAERQYQQIEWLKGSQVTRTGRGSDYEVKGLFEATPRLVEVKTGKARLSRLQRATGPQVVRENVYVNAAAAAGVGIAGGVVLTEAVKRLLNDYVRSACRACGTQTNLDHRFCPRCNAPLSRATEFWIGVSLGAAGAIILILCVLTLRLDLSLMLLGGGLLGAGLDLVSDGLWVTLSNSRSSPGSSTN